MEEQLGGVAAGSLDVQVHHPRGGLTLAVVRGPLDATTAPALGKLLVDAALGGGRVRSRLVLDLAGVTAADADGIDALRRVATILEARGCAIEILGPPASIVVLLHDAALGASAVSAAPGEE